jgi:tetratricopeptide (TPR) repeat protein
VAVRADQAKAKGDCKSALELYRLALRLYPASPRAGHWYGCIGFCANELKSFEVGLAACSEAIRLNPRDAAAYSNRGFAHTRLNQHTQAVSDFSRAIELHPESVDYGNRAEAYAGLKQWSNAMDDAQKAVTLASDPMKPVWQQHLENLKRKRPLEEQVCSPQFFCLLCFHSRGVCVLSGSE